MERIRRVLQIGNEAIEPPTDRIVRSAAEHAFGGRIEDDDAQGFVGRDNAVHRGVDDSGQPFFTDPPAGTDAMPFDGVVDGSPEPDIIQLALGEVVFGSFPDGARCRLVIGPGRQHDDRDGEWEGAEPAKVVITGESGSSSASRMMSNAERCTASCASAKRATACRA